MDEPLSPVYNVFKILKVFFKEANNRETFLTKLILGIVSFVLLLIFSALISTAETAFISSSYIKLEEINSNKKSKRCQILLKMMKNPNKFLSTVQVINTLIAFANGSISSTIFMTSFIDMTNLSGKLSGTQGTIIFVLITIALSIFTSYFQIVIGELVPKRLGMKSPEKLSIRLIYFVMIWYILFYPFVAILTFSTTLVARIFGVKKGDEIKAITEEEIKVMIKSREDKGTDQKIESAIINNVFEFNDTEVDEIMTHRTEVAAIDIKSSKEEIFKMIKEQSFTRYPVFEENIDNVIGILHAKDVLTFLIGKKKEFNLKDLVRPPYFVFEGKKINSLFQEMKKNRFHMAIVVDEYGGTAGIVTLEDLIEEVLGDIDDEYDDNEPKNITFEKGIYKVLGHTPLEDLENELKIDLPVEDFETVSGFIIAKYNKIPKDGEKISFDFNGYQFETVKVKEMVIVSCIIRKIKTENEDK